jgi:hypothetical protein
MQTMCGAEIVCPKPIGRGVSLAQYDCMSIGKNLVRGILRITLIVLGELSMPCFTKLSISFSHSAFSKLETPKIDTVRLPF